MSCLRYILYNVMSTGETETAGSEAILWHHLFCCIYQGEVDIPSDHHLRTVFLGRPLTLILFQNSYMEALVNAVARWKRGRDLIPLWHYAVATMERHWLGIDKSAARMIPSARAVLHGLVDLEYQMRHTLQRRLCKAKK